MQKLTVMIVLLISSFILNAQNYLNQPQKIVIDEKRNRYLVSNFGSYGILVAIDSADVQSPFVPNAHMIDGMVIVGDSLIGSAGPYPTGSVRVYNLITGNLDTTISLSDSGVTHLSSFVADSNGIVYTSERWGDRIFKINPKTGRYWVLAQGNGIDQPNGLLLEPEKNRMLVCLDKYHPPIMSINLSDSTVSTIATTTLAGSDGIEKDIFGNYYITGYELPGVYKFDSTFTQPPELIHSGIKIIYPTYHEKHNSLLITYYSANTWGEILLDNNLLDNPESVVYDSLYNRYLVSNCGNGKIIQIDSTGHQSYFNTELTYTLGLHIVGDTLYVSSNGVNYSGVVGFSLSTGDIVFYVNIPEKQLLNDITSDNDGNLYVTDCDGNKVYRVNINTMTYSAFVSSGLGYPNGILYDAPNDRLLVLNCLLGGYPIKAINLPDSSVSTVVNTGKNSIDGITIDNDGNYYFSSWATDETYRYDQTFTNPPEVISSGHNDPADIFFDRINNVLVVPNYSSNSVDFIQVTPSSINTEANELTEFKLAQNYPNPFNPTTRINYELSMTTKVSLKIYNTLGEEIKTLVDEVQASGTKTVVWEGNDKFNRPVSSGVYLYFLNTGEFNLSKKMLLLR